ncbi:hypothetical protein ACN95_14280 [Gordonia sihwensis]|uniref:DUF732 domain-containing protein n=1 Tax=Gordonia sihwensis TaxID=173559 RepID=UPI001C92E92D|nr:DUF732 domain-containing protein [Gordonia sihwensis]MBY4571185.1 hypothetical protein [Gordonia sihwensis]
MTNSSNSASSGNVRPDNDEPTGDRRPGLARLGVVLAIFGGILLIGFPSVVKDPEIKSELGSLVAYVIVAIAMVLGGIVLVRKHRDRTKRPMYVGWTIGAVLVIAGVIMNSLSDPAAEEQASDTAKTTRGSSSTAGAGSSELARTPTPIPDFEESPEQERAGREQSFIDTVKVARVSVESGRSGMIRTGYQVCAYIDKGNTPVEAVEAMVSSNPTWSNQAAAAVVGAAIGTLCPEHS